MPEEHDDTPLPERYPPPWTDSAVNRWLILVAYTGGIVAIMWWALVKEVT